MKTRNYSPARVRSASYNEEANTIDIVWSTGADVLRSEGYEEYIERLSMEPSAVRLGRLNAGAPFLDTHNSDGLSSVIGSVVPGTARIEGGKGLATIRLSKAAADADTVQKIREGVIRNISVGYWTHAQTRSDDSPPVVTVTDWEPLEISGVPIPADPGAQIRSASHKRPRDRQSPTQRAAAYASRLLSQTTQSHDHARGAAEARKLQYGAGKYRTESPKPVVLDKLEIERGARAARRLLRRKA
jgi:phage head maturation protease